MSDDRPDWANGLGLECRAAVLGYEVRWKGSFEDFLQRLRGAWEMSDGYAVLRQR